METSSFHGLLLLVAIDEARSIIECKLKCRADVIRIEKIISELKFDWKKTIK